MLLILFDRALFDYLKTYATSLIERNDHGTGTTAFREFVALILPLLLGV
jgi:hypothetical protein